jgi:alpha-tubulin suppressor-like RCC1 family protein/serine/threonine protein kinase
MISENTPQRVAELFEAAMREEPARRPEFLAEACGANQELWDEVSSLVLEYERRGETEDPARDWAGDEERPTDSASEGRQPAHLIGRYEAGRELGRGGMGVVYEAFDPVLGRRIALKTIRLVGYGTPLEQGWLRARLLREARTAALLDHPNIVRVYDSGVHEELAYVAMELVEGPTLERRMRTGRLEAGDALSILRQVAVALDYSHSAGVVHRDVKPANIMLRRGEEVKITDFGIAQIATAEHPTRTTLTVGTPSYMSPEQIRKRHVDGRSDQFSLAVMSFEMLTGAKPFLAESDFDLMQKIVAGESKSVSNEAPHLPAMLDAVFQRAFATNCEDRFPTCAEFVCALEEGIGAAQIRLAPGPAPQEASGSIGSERESARTADHLEPSAPGSEAATLDHTDQSAMGRRSKTWTALLRNRWRAFGAAAGLILLLSWSANSIFVERKAPKPGGALEAMATASTNLRHFILNLDFEQLGLRTEAFLDNRLSNPNREAGSFEWRTLPSQVRGITDILDMAGGWGQTAVIESDGTVWTWGSEYLGVGSPIINHPDPSPLRVAKTVSFRSVACGSGHCLALAENGTVWAWGDNDFAELGDGTTISRRTPVKVSGLADVAAIAAYAAHSLALKQDGTVWSWGRDSDGRNLRRIPIQLPLLENIASIAAGERFDLALKKDGTVWAWSRDATMRTGEGKNGYLSTPMPVNGISGVTAIAAGTNHAVARKKDGTVWTWGRNAYGELGDGSATDRWTPVQVPGLESVVAVAAGAQHTLALLSDGTVRAWGQNSSGVLGDGTMEDSHSPGPVRGLSGVVSIASGGQHGLARKKDGTLWTWGWNDYGQLGRQAVRELESVGTKSATVNYVRIAGPKFEMIRDGFPWILFDRAPHRIVLQPGNFGTSQWGAALGYDVAADGKYAISGAFQRANSNPYAGDGVDVAIVVDGDDNHPLWAKHIATNNLAPQPFSVVAQLRQRQVVRFVVYSGPQGKNGNSDETSLVATIDRQEGENRGH